MDIFLRFAAETDYLPNPFFTKAYDARILYILFGEGEIRFPEKTFPLREGTLCYYPSGQAYWPLSSPENKLRFITLNFDFTRQYKDKTKVLPPVAEQNFCSELSLATHLSVEHDLYQGYFVFSDAHAFRDDLLFISNLFNSTLTHGRMAASARLCSLLYTLLDRTEAHACAALTRAILYIDKHYASLSSNAELGQALHYHPYYLNRLFRRHTGKTLHRYVMESRLKHAAQLLTETDYSVSDIAEQVGFENADHFSHCFSLLYGVPPTKFRRTSRLI